MIDYTFWELIGASKKDILNFEDILDIGKRKSQKRVTETKIRRLKNEPLTLKSIEVEKYFFENKQIFYEFYIKLILEENQSNIKLAKEFYSISSISKLLLQNFKISPIILVRGLSFKLAKFINTMNLTDNSLILYELLENNNFNIMNKFYTCNNSLYNYLAFTNDHLKTRLLNDYNIKINSIDEETFSIYFSYWRNERREIKLIHILHFIENISAEIKKEVYFQLLLYRCLIFYKKKFQIDEKFFAYIIKTIKYCSTKQKINSNSNSIEKKYNLFNFEKNIKKEFKLYKLYKPFKEYDLLFREKKYDELIDKLEKEESVTVFSDNLDKTTFKLRNILIVFIIHIKIKSKFVKKVYKLLSIVLRLNLLNIKIDFNEIHNLLKNVDDLSECLRILNKYLQKNVDFLLIE
jgi:hypothetical protein